MRVLILYYSKTGHTLEAASAAASGIRSAGAEADLVATKVFDATRLADYDTLLVASPCWGGSITPSGVALPVIRVLDALEPEALAGKRCAGISVHSGVGAETTVKTLGQILTAKGCQDYASGPVARAGVPFSIWKGPSVTPEDQERLVAFGADFVT